MAEIFSVSVQSEDFDPQAIVQALCHGRADIGAVVTFVGLVRDTAKNQQITSMELEHYPGMTEKALQKIIDKAKARWSLQAASIVHRVGKLAPAEQIVMVAVASAHRGEAFAACEFMIDFLKTQAPFWKKEHSASGGQWVDARSSDNQAVERWGK